MESQVAKAQQKKNVDKPVTVREESVFSWCSSFCFRVTDERGSAVSRLSKSPHEEYMLV